MTKKVTMQMIADELNVTKVSVSKALNNQEGVGPELRDKILEKARSMGYIKKSRRGDTTVKHFGFIEPKKYFLESGDFFTAVYYALLQICNEKKIRLHLHVVGEEEEASPSFPFPFEQNGMDGIFLGGELKKDYLDHLREYNIPTVALGFYEVHNAIDAVILDDYTNSNLIANTLVEMGHKDIGFLGDHKCARSALDRYFGFLKALEENDLEFHKEWLISDIDEHGRNITEYALPERLPTAFICHSDFAAYNLMLKLTNAGISVPEDVALATFDHTERALNSKAVIMVDITGETLARAAFQQMQWRCNNPELEHKRIFVNAPLIVRRP